VRSALALTIGLLIAGCEQAPVLSGRYHYGGEVDIVCPCAATECYWVRAEPDVAEQLHEYAQRQARTPYQAMFLRWHGHLLDEPGVGFAANYDGLMRVDEVLTLSAEIPADCPAP